LIHTFDGPLCNNLTEGKAKEGAGEEGIEEEKETKLCVTKCIQNNISGFNITVDLSPLMKVRKPQESISTNPLNLWLG